MNVGILVILAVFDSKVGVFEKPFTVRSNAEGMRTFADEVLRPESMLGLHPSDYSLFRVGSFDQTTGATIPELAPIQLMTALEVAGRKEAGLKVSA